MSGNGALERLTEVLRQEREAFQSTAEMATAAGVPYDALYGLLTGNRARGVSVEMLTVLAHRFPKVGALFLAPDSQICTNGVADAQGASS